MEVMMANVRRGQADGQREENGASVSSGRVVAESTERVEVNGGISGTFRSKAFASLIGRDPTVARAVSFLVQRGVPTGSRSRKVSTRVDPGVMDAAKERFGLSSESDVINASLAIAAAPDRFKAWLQDSRNTVTEDFELAV